MARIGREVQVNHFSHLFSKIQPFLQQGSSPLNRQSFLSLLQALKRAYVSETVMKKKCSLEVSWSASHLSAQAVTRFEYHFIPEITSLAPTMTLVPSSWYWRSFLQSGSEIVESRQGKDYCMTISTIGRLSLSLLQTNDTLSDIGRCSYSLPTVSVGMRSMKVIGQNSSLGSSGWQQIVFSFEVSDEQGTQRPGHSSVSGSTLTADKQVDLPLFEHKLGSNSIAQPSAHSSPGSMS